MPASAQIIYEDLHLVPTYAKAHGIAMGLAFTVMMPLGIFIIRIPNSKHAVYVHAGWQLLSWIMMIAGLVFGLRVGKILNRVRYHQFLFTSGSKAPLADSDKKLHNNTHTVFGTVIVVLLILQPFLGLGHHLRFRKTQKRGMWTRAHVWYGRLLILLGIINGGLGLQLAANTLGGRIAYGIVGFISGVAMICTTIMVDMNLRKPANIGAVAG